jgi:hypothetical protein
VSKSTFISDLNARIKESEKTIADHQANLSALRHLLSRETGGDATSEPEASANNGHSSAGHADIDFKGRTSDIILAIVQRSGENGTRPRDISEILLSKKLVSKGSNTVHSHLSELKKRGMVRQNPAGLYVVPSKPAVAAAPATPAKTAKKKHRLSAAGREAIRAAQKARWAASKKAK